MADLTSPATISPTLLQPVATSNLAAAAKLKAKDAGDRFESQFMSTMLQQMFEGVKTDGPFGGGFGEDMFRSLLTDAMAQKITKSGGIGVSASIQREILKLQGLK